MRRCVVFGASREKDYGNLRSLISDEDFIACADGGYEIAVSIGLKPDIVIGDGDSGGAASSGVAGGVARITLPREKDATDLACAVDHCLGLGFTDFLLLCCAGNRFDHHFANVCLLERLSERGARGVLQDGKNRVLLHSGGAMRFTADSDHKYISLLALDEKICGVTLTGLKYPLRDACLERSSQIGVSNEFILPEATIEIKKGKALVVFSGD